MKAAKWQRTVSLLLCLLMAMSFFVITVPKAYAAEPTWPYLASIDESSFTNFNLRDDFPAPEENLKKVDIQHVTKLEECADVKTSGATTTYHAGTIVLYVETLPTSEDKSPTATANAKCGFKFQIGSEGSGTAKKSKITLKNVEGNYTEKFYTTVTLKTDAKLYDHSRSNCYVMTEGKIAYHYDVKVQQYTGEEKAEPEWPHLTSVGNPINDKATKPFFIANNLREDFTFTLKDVKIEHAKSLTECALGTTAGYTAYDAGTIKFYVDNLPTESDKLESFSGTAYGFKFQTGNDLVTVSGTGDGDTVKFANAVMLNVAGNFEYHNKTYYYIQTAKNVRYHYNVQVLQYNGETGEELTLSAGSAKRTDKETAIVTFNASAAGNYYYALHDEQQTAPVVDTTSANTNMGTMAKTNTITVSGITDYKAKYLYIVGVDAAGKTSVPLEIVIPGITFALKHEKQSIYSVSLYTEQFTDSEGKPITAATPGDTVIVNFGVFEAGNDNVIYEDGAIKHKASVRQTVLTQWNMTGLTLDPAPTGSSFRFTMPENDVTIQAETKLDGVPIHVTSNMPNVTQELEARAYFTNPYGLPGGNVGYTIPICANQDQTDVVMAGTKVRLRVVSIPETYVLDKWAITNNGTPVDKSEITLSEDGSSAELTLAEGGDYVFNAVLRAKKFASVTAAVNDSTMGSATVTVDGNQQAVYEGQNVTLTAIPGDSYMLERWEVREEDSDDLIATTPVEGNANQVTFTMPATDKNITAKAFFAFDPAKASTECGLDSVELDVPGASVERRGGNFTIKVPANTSADTLAAAALKFITVSEDADVIRAGDETPWPTDGQACGMTLDTPVTFTVRSQKYLLGGDDNAKADYTVTVVRTKSTECAIEIAKLGNVVGVLDQTKKTVTFTVPADTEDSAVADMLLTINCSQYASIKLKGAETDWVNDTACGMKLNEEKTFVVTAEDGTTTAKYTVVIHRTPSDKKALTGATLGDIAAVINEDSHAVTFTVPADTTDSTLGEMILKLTVSDYATVKKSGDKDNWPAEGKACGMELNNGVIFTVKAEDDTTVDYTVTIAKTKSSEKDITAAVLLNQTGDTTPFAKAQISGTNIIFTLPSDTDKAVLNSIGMKYLKLTYPESATAKMKNGYDDATNAGYRWSNGDVMCNMSINSPVKFTVTAEDGSTKEYTIEIKYTAPAAPTLSDGSATRSSKTAATVKFTTNEAGTYYYKVVTHGATAPTADEIVKSTTKGTASAGETTFTLSNLTEDARDVYIVVVSAAGGESAPLKVEIPAYGSGTDTPDTGAYKISISAPKGGTITTNRTKADAGDEIIVTVTPDNGYQMVSGSLTYTLATAGGETKTITNGRFTMPAGDVSITCKWETATTTAKGITSFSINGIAGAVNNTTNTITITMPRGTDVTKLTPTISTNGVKSLTPGSGETVNFTNSVNYTATMEDGSTKTYTVTVYVEKGTLSDQFWDKLTDFVNQVPWWEYAKQQQSTSSYPKYW